MLVHVADASGKFQAVPIENLAELIDPDAAVFWDRDMPDVELEVFADKPALRFVGVPLTSPICWMAFTGADGNAVAYWNPKTKKWISMCPTSAASS